MSSSARAPCTSLNSSYVLEEVSTKKEYVLREDPVEFEIPGDNISDIDTNISGTSFKLNDVEYKTKLIGEYNVYNLSIVIILLDILGINDIDLIKELDPPEGRMDIIKYKGNLIIVDFAHTPDAVYKIIDNVSKIKHNKIITLIGCGGNRDKSKRSIMGSIVTTYSDYVIFTSDNPRYEDPNSILHDITYKLDKNNYEIIVNREKAINKSIQMLSKNDILLLFIITQNSALMIL